MSMFVELFRNSHNLSFFLCAISPIPTPPWYIPNLAIYDAASGVIRCDINPSFCLSDSPADGNNLPRTPPANEPTVGRNRSLKVLLETQPDFGWNGKGGAVVPAASWDDASGLGDGTFAWLDNQLQK